MDDNQKITPEEVQKALLDMVELGYVETFINEEGELAYQLTESGYTHSSTSITLPTIKYIEAYHRSNLKTIPYDQLAQNIARNIADDLEKGRGYKEERESA